MRNKPGAARGELDEHKRGGALWSRSNQPYLVCLLNTDSFLGGRLWVYFGHEFLEDWTRRIWYLLARQEELKGDIGAETGFDQGDLIYLGAYFGGTINIDASFGAYDLAKATGRR